LGGGEKKITAAARAKECVSTGARLRCWCGKGIASINFDRKKEKKQRGWKERDMPAKWKKEKEKRRTHHPRETKRPCAKNARKGSTYFVAPQTENWLLLWSGHRRKRKTISLAETGGLYERRGGTRRGSVPQGKKALRASIRKVKRRGYGAAGRGCWPRGGG